VRWADIGTSRTAPLESGSGYLDGRRGARARAAVFADRAPSPIIRDFFVMNAAGRKITLLPELIYLGRAKAAIHPSIRREGDRRRRRCKYHPRAPFESGHV